jgi:hypothetical protein
LFHSPYIQRITNDAREDEMEENLVMVGANLTNLKNMAQDMGNVIERQNKQLDRMGDKVRVLLFEFEHSAMTPSESSVSSWMDHAPRFISRSRYLFRQRMSTSGSKMPTTGPKSFLISNIAGVTLNT